MAGLDKGRFRRRDVTVGGQVLTVGRDGKGMFYRRDGTEKYNGRDFLGATGRYG